MRLNKHEQIVAAPSYVLKQRLNVISEQEPNRIHGLRLDGPTSIYNFAVHGTTTYAFVTAEEVLGSPHETKVTIETYLISHNWPAWLTVIFTLTVIWLAVIKPTGIQLGCTLFFAAYLTGIVLTPQLSQKRDEQRVLTAVKQLIDETT
jgi:hypothetical protein